MVQNLSRHLGKRLQNAGYTFLVAENQASRDQYIFEPTRWEVDVFLDGCILTTFDDHAILIISEMLNDSDDEIYSNHQVVIPENLSSKHS